MTMCGIYGELLFGGGGGHDLDRYGQACTDALSHRGPDERGTMVNGQVFLGMRRLSIIDLEGGSQPIWNESKSRCGVYNGEVYNFRELRGKLEAKGYQFRSRSDTEVVMKAYDAWGADALRRFNGMFALAIWDKQEERLFLARDRVGEKPLYYFRDSQRFIFSSEIKAILTNPAVPRSLNPKGLVNFFAAGHSVGPDTIYQSIYKLLPGHWLCIKDGGITLSRYWDVGDDPYLPPEADRSEKSLEVEIQKLLDDSVRLRMLADVPVGAFLSGGVDSSAVVALMQRHAKDPVKTFSVGFGIGGAYNELSDARRVATALGTEHRELNIEHCDLVNTLRTLVYHYDEPFGDPAGFPLYLLSQLAGKHVKVVLTGDGADELFGGYRRYSVDRLAGLYQCLPATLTQRVLPALIDRLPRLRRLKRTLSTLPLADPARRYAAWLTVFTPEMQAELLNDDLYACVAGYDPAWIYAEYYPALKTEAADHLNRLMYADVKTLLVDAYLEKTDKATMACGLEARVPLLDHRLVELAFQIPSRYKVRGRQTKSIFKNAVRGLMDGEVLRRQKHGFSVPLDPWFRGDLKTFAFDVLLDGRARRRGYFNMEFVEQLWREHADCRHVWDTQLWLLLNFELWHRIYLDGEAV